MKKKSKRWIKDSAVQNETVIHLFDFFFTATTKIVNNVKAFVLFVSLWFLLFSSTQIERDP
jgi:hypothetical protein